MPSYHHFILQSYLFFGQICYFVFPFILVVFLIQNHTMDVVRNITVILGSLGSESSTTEEHLAGVDSLFRPRSDLATSTWDTSQGNFILVSVIGVALVAFVFYMYKHERAGARARAVTRTWVFKFYDASNKSWTPLMIIQYAINWYLHLMI